MPQNGTPKTDQVQDTSDPKDEKKGGGSNLGRIIKRIAGGSAVLIVGLLVWAWFAGMPRGELRVLITSSPEAGTTHGDVGRQLLNEADAALSQVQSDYETLLRFTGGDMPPALLPPSAGPEQGGLRRFIVKAAIEANPDMGPTSGSFVFDVLSLLEWSYEFFGKQDKILVIKEIAESRCAEDDLAPCYRVMAQYWPSAERQLVVSGEQSEIARALALHVLRSEVGVRTKAHYEEGDDGQPLPFVEAVAIPRTTAALQQTALGLDILRVGRAHRHCEGLSVGACIERAQALLTEAEGQTAEDGPNPFAAFGRAALSTHAAFEAARQLASEIVVEQHLSDAELATSRALRSAHLRAATSRPDAPIRLELLQLQDVLPSEQLITQFRRFSCALAEYRRGFWQKCIEEVGELESFPAPLRPYMASARLDAQLQLASHEEFEMFFDDLKGEIAAEAENSHDQTHLLKRVLLRHSCGRPHVLNTAEFENLLERTANAAPSSEARDEIMMQAAACHANQEFPSSALVEDFATRLDLEVETVQALQWALRVAAIRLRQGAAEEALELLERAARLPWARMQVQFTPEFAPLMASPEHARRFIDSSFRVERLPEAETCHRYQEWR